MADVTDTVAASGGAIYVAPVGTAFPVDIDTAPGAGWVDIGALADDAGVTRNGETTVTDKRRWGSPNVYRSMTTDRVDGIAATVIDVLNIEAWKLIHNGGSIVAGVFTPPVAGSDYEVAVVFDVVDGTRKIRYEVQRAKNVAAPAIDYPNGDDLASAPIDLRFLEPTTGEIYTVESNDTEWVAAS